MDIPDDLQRMDIDVSLLKEFVPPALARSKDISKDVQTLVSWIQAARRPLVIYGAGIRIAGVIEPALQFIRQWHLPVVLTWGGKDMMTYDDPLEYGRYRGGGAAGR